MQEFRGRVAVITGAASGIGFALAERASQEGMTVVLADVETKALESAAASLRERGGKVAAQRVDVSNEADVEGLATRVFEEFGAFTDEGRMHLPPIAGELSPCQVRLPA